MTSRTTGRIWHCVIAMGIEGAALHAVHALPQLPIVIFGSVVAMTLMIFGYHFETHWQRSIALRFPRLHWDVPPDLDAELAWLVGALLGFVLWFCLGAK
jgi:hypothetical protein